MRMKHGVAIAGLVAGVLAGGAAGIALTSPGVAHGDTSSTTTTTASRREGFLERALAPLVEKGTITQPQADAVIEALQDARPDHVPGRRGFGPLRGIGVIGDAFAAAAKTLDMSTDELRAALRDGKSIADVAEEKDVDTDKVVDAMVAAVRAELDQAVDDGKITREHAGERLEALRDRVSAFVNGEFSRVGERGGFFGPGPGRWHRDGGRP